jgi:S-adenosylmethionine synthetase
VGKIYNILTHKIADEIYTRVQCLREVYVWLVSQIGKPIDQPAIAAVRVIPEPGTKFESIRGQIAEIIDSELERIDEFTKELAEGKYPVC